MISITVQNLLNTNTITVAINHHPDICPLCNHANEPKMVYATISGNETSQLQVAYKCNKDGCRQLFIGYFEYLGTSNNLPRYDFKKSAPSSLKQRDFEKEIIEISPQFEKIYNQAVSAEQLGLDQICGVGYRKSFEFLIKDYLISNEPQKEEEIKKKLLGQCITKDIMNENVKRMAQRATWLGNDETHYIKKWEDKDISDLKKLIEVTLHWISMEILTKKYEAEMV